jgi:O-antigen biosynthesis protein
MLESSDERFDQSQYGRFRCEHLHRYRLALALAKDRDVLDIACGEGYGSAALAKTARSVVGVDIAPEVVAHAARTYPDPKLRFLEGACDALPLPDTSIDLIVSFETIEHHERHEEMMTEFSRVLRHGGLVLLSSPNREVYSTDHINPFHVRELSRTELEALLKRHFAHHRLVGQRSWLVSLTYGEPGEADLMVEGSLPEPEYLLALASNTPLEIEIPTQTFFDAADDAMERVERLFVEQAVSYRSLETEYTQQQETHYMLEEAYRKLEATERDQREAYQEVQQQIVAVTQEHRHLEDEFVKLSKAHRALEEAYVPLEQSYFAIENQLREALAHQQEQAIRIAEMERQLDKVRQAPAYRVGRRLGLAPPLDKEPPP